MSAVILVLFSLSRVSTLSVVAEKRFPSWFESTAAVKKPAAVVRPVSHVPSFGGHAVRASRDPYQLMVIRAPPVPDPSYPRRSPT